MALEDSSIGIIEKRTVDIPLDGGFKLRKGGTLPELTVAYEAYGELSEKKDNVVYICTALTGDAHAAGYHSADDPKPGWWDQMIGPGKGIDTDYYHVICANILGGCQGTTGPCSINPETGKPFGVEFPEITVADIVRVQKLFLETLGIDRLAAAIGGSFGGMQVLEWGIQYPDSVDRCVCIAAAPSLSTQALAFDVVARDAITSDPNWQDGHYYDGDNKPEWGLAHARKIGHITYLSPEIMQKKFGRDKVDGSDGSPEKFQVESYLEYQGRKLVERFDANSYLLLTRALEGYDLEEEYGSIEKAFEKTNSKFLIVALSSDWLFPPEQSLSLANALLRAGREVSCCTLEAPYGHDAFLIDIEYLASAVKAFLPWVGEKKSSDILSGAGAEFSIIEKSIKDGAKVLDLGCGDGTLLSMLRESKNVSGLGFELQLRNVIEVINKGHDVLQGDLDEGLSSLPDRSYDYAILSSTLQQVKKPRYVLREIVRVAEEGIITFPNFAYWRNRLALGFKGRMPTSEALPYEWYDTPNIHLTTRADFFDLCDREGIEVIDMFCIPGGSLFDKLLAALRCCNLGGAWIVARVRKG
jgi:homoserine O-acetyltransferase